MIIKTEGILLKKKSYREKNEIIIFFTEKLGKISCFSYGSKSIKSLRRVILSRFNWVEIELEHKRNAYILKGLTEKKINLLTKKVSDFLFLSHILKIIDCKVPYESKENDFYQFLQVINHQKIVKKSLLFKEFIFLFSFLYFLGVFPVFNGNEEAFSKEKDRFIYNIENQEYVFFSLKQDQSLPVFKFKSLEFLNFFCKHFSNQLSFYLSIYNFLYKNELYKEIEIKKMVLMGKRLIDNR